MEQEPGKCFTGVECWSFFFFLMYFFKFYFIFKLYIIVLVLPNIKMNPPGTKNPEQSQRGRNAQDIVQEVVLGVVYTHNRISVCSV